MRTAEFIAYAGVYTLLVVLFVQAVFSVGRGRAPTDAATLMRVRVRPGWRLLQRSAVGVASISSFALFVWSFSSEGGMNDWMLAVTVWLCAIAAGLAPLGSTLDLRVSGAGICLRSILINWDELEAVQDDGTVVWLYTQRKWWNTWHGRIALPRYVWDIREDFAPSIMNLRERVRTQQRLLGDG